MTGDDHQAQQERAPGAPRTGLRRLLSLRSFIIFSAIHCVMFTGLMVCAFGLGGPQPITFMFGFAHGVMYMIVCAGAIVAARMRTLSVTTALVVAIVGALGPYFGMVELVREDRRRRAEVDPVAG